MLWTNNLAAVTCALALTCGAASGLAQMGELVDRDTLRVCADPNHLPFSNEAGEGFENKIAELLAADLGVDLAYTWHPQVIGFVRNTLGARACDLVMGITSTSEVMQNTNPYYRSSYALVQRADAGTKVTSLGDPKLADLRIGAVAQTPPIDVLAQRALLKNVRPYQLMVDTRYDDPGRQMIEDLAADKIDVGVLWGPIAGYWAKQQSVPIEVVPLTGENTGARLDFRITMGLRRNEPEWKGILNEFLAQHKAEIQEILLEYGVPLLDEQGHQIKAAADTRQGALESAAGPRT
jgi:quinoprotein dehydrogenase-associated probable ABC transporter substrate-binding protein